MRDRLRQAVERVGVEDRPDQRRQQPVPILADVTETVPEEAHGTALPPASEDLGDRGPQASVGV
jgi:hypothetical protein